MEKYSDKVMDHFSNPRNVGEIPDASGVGTVGNPICVVPETLVFTNPGISSISEVSEHTAVLSHDGRYHNVELVHKRLYKGKLYTLFVNNLGACSVTPEHHILGLKLGNRDKIKNHKKVKPDWYCSQELEKGDVILYPLPKDTKDTKECDFDIQKPRWDFKSKPLPEKIEINKEFCRLVGYYLSEGYVRTDKSKGTIGFVFNAREKTYIKDVADLMKRAFNVKPAELMHNQRNTSSNIAFYSARIARFFEKNFGKDSYNKHIPHWMMLLPSAKQEAILCGLFRGDGYFDLKRQRAKFVTASLRLAYQVRMMLLRQKIISNFSIGKAYGIHRESYLTYIQDDNSLKKITDIMGLQAKINPKQSYRHKSWFDNDFYYTTLREIKPVLYRGLVYNLEVEDSHSYVSNALTLHNCGDVMKMYIKIEKDIIVDAKFKTFGCGAAVATSSMVTEMVKGKTIEEALKISNKAVAEALGGLPPIKMHCSVLAEEALRSALVDYYNKQGKEPPFEHKDHAHGH